MRKLTRRELALMLGAGALAGTASGRVWRPSTHQGVVGLAEAKAGLGKPLGQETARLAMAGALAASVGVLHSARGECAFHAGLVDRAEQQGGPLAPPVSRYLAR